MNYEFYVSLKFVITYEIEEANLKDKKWHDIRNVMRNTENMLSFKKKVITN